MTFQSVPENAGTVITREVRIRYVEVRVEEIHDPDTEEIVLMVNGHPVKRMNRWQARRLQILAGDR